MPLYEYQCDQCSGRFERIRKFSDPPLEESCPSCGGPIRKLISSPAIQFKGKGWYVTDYAKSGAPGESKADAASSEAKADAKSDAKKAGTPDAKPETKAESQSETKSDAKADSKTDAAAKPTTPAATPTTPKADKT